MVRHIVMWNFKDGFTDEQNAANARKIKADLEHLADVIGEIKTLSVEITPLPSSNRDIMLNSLFESEETLKVYQAHPEHVRVSGFVGSVTQNRACIDYHE